MPRSNVAVLAPRSSFSPPRPRIGYETQAFEHSLSSFMRNGWCYAREPTDFVPNWHLDLMDDYLTAAVDRQIRGPLIFTMPPVHAKSIKINVFLPAWLWAQSVPEAELRKGRAIRKDSWRGPGVRFASIAYEQKLSNRDSDKCRSLIESDWYQERWGGRFRLHKTGIELFNNSAGGSRQALSFSGGLTGFHAHIIAIDDAHNIMSDSFEVDRLKVLDAWDNALQSRLLDDGGNSGVWIMAMQRSAENDLIAHILSREFNGIHVCLPAEYERKHPFAFVTPPAPQQPGDIDQRVMRKTDSSDGTDVGPRRGEFWRDARAETEPLWPRRFPPSRLRELEAGMSSHAIAGQYQQRPTAREGGLFKRAWFDNPSRRVPDFSRLDLVRSWDLASSEATSNNPDPDYTVGLLMGRDRETSVIYILDVIRGRYSPAELQRRLKTTAIIDGYNVRIRLPRDPGGAGKFQAQLFVTMLQGWSVTIEPEGSGAGSGKTAKERRADPFAAQCEHGNVKLISDANSNFKWNGIFVDELCAFSPTCAHDDQVDAAAAGFRALTRQTHVGLVGA
jgi:predicted phage terminase large subunit-like protein